MIMRTTIKSNNSGGGGSNSSKSYNGMEQSMLNGGTPNMRNERRDSRGAESGSNYQKKRNTGGQGGRRIRAQ